MPRFFNDTEVELLAPCGTFEIFEKIIKLPCDAVYFGGKKLNMRLHRKDYNFSDAEITEAIHIAHGMGKKVYITVNNLHSKEDLNQLEEYLHFLSEAKPDAIIIQDFSIIEYAKKLDLEVHASVMMNVHNLETVKRLESLGISQIVMSREVPISYIKFLSQNSNLKFEYFVHGDMCIAHGGQCLYSGILFGKSSNRGQCLKPCRWDYDIKANNKMYNQNFPLAVKDMYMYEHLPELIHNGVTSFKIEGRMRDFEYLQPIVSMYGDAINRYIENPTSYQRKENAQILHENRKRDFSTAYAFGKPGLKNINTRFEGTGKFYSTGKVFSTATEEKGINDDKISKLKEFLINNKINNRNGIKLSVKTNDFQQAKLCLDKNVHDIYLSGDTFAPSKPFSKDEILYLTKNKKDKKIYMSLPRMMSDMDFEEYGTFLKYDLGIDGILCTNLGAINKFKNHKLRGDYALNIYNEKSAHFFIHEGLEQFTISPEIQPRDLVDILSSKSKSAELIIHGSPVVMYMDHNLFDNIPDEINDKILLVDDAKFEHPVFKDRNNKNHFMLYKDICLLPVLKELHNAGLSNFRIQAMHLDMDELENILDIYGKVISDLDNCELHFNNLLKSSKKSFSLGALELKS